MLLRNEATRYILSKNFQPRHKKQLSDREQTSLYRSKNALHWLICCSVFM